MISPRSLQNPGLGLTGPRAALVALCRREQPAASLTREWPGFEAAAFQRALHESAMRHEVLGLVLTSLLKGGTGAALGGELRDGYGHTLQLLRRRAALWDLERDFVLSRLAAAGISVVLLKGAALRLSVYTDPVERQFGDVDVLVPPEQIAAAIPVLEASGYLPESVFTAQLYLEHHHHLRLKKATGFMVELHWALEPPDSPFELDPAAFRAEASPASGAGGVLVPRAEHMLLHLATQNVEDGYSLLRRLVDLDRVIAATPRLDWDFLAAEVIRMKVTAPVAVSLRLAALLLETEFPQGFIASLGLTRAVRSNLALLDPVGLVTEQRAVTRAALSRLVVLWSIADRATRRRVFRDMSAGRYGELGRRLDGLPPVGRWTSRAQAAKILAYQGWLYGTLPLGGSAMRRGSRFWHGA